MGSADDIAIGSEFSLRVDGRVGSDGPVSVAALLELVTGLDAGRPSIALVDVFAPIRLAASADVLIVHSTERSIVLPVRAVMRRPNIRLIIEATPAGWVVLLDAPGWTDDGAPFVVDRVTALTFIEFVMRS